ncbi:MAG TPA: zinc-binding dehydrogenase [Candidatus Eremiobacteraceae bacterium]|nr:zinc-binding dehydrogenase [Candidatus Eremiobacteraceae bacterium]
MRAVFASRLGGDAPLDNLSIGERPEPQPGPGEVRVRVHAATLNRHDYFTLQGVVAYPFEPPRILGCDAAGIVDRYGPDRPPDSPDPGTPVAIYPVTFCGRCAGCGSGDPMLCARFTLLSDGDREGSFGDFLVVPAKCVLPKPETLSFAQTAALGTTFLTAYRMLFVKAALMPGQSVLVQGAGGGLATAAISLACAAGLTVYVSSRSAERLEAAQRIGARHAVLAGRDAAKTILKLSGGGVDAVIESVGEATWATSLRALRQGGTIVVSGATAGPNPPADLARVFWRQLQIKGSSMGTIQEFRDLLHFVATRDIKPLIDHVYPAEHARDAFVRLAAGDVFGKLALSFE